MLCPKSWIHFSFSVVAVCFFTTLSSADVINCSSNDMKRQYCPANTRGGVRIVEQHSDADCRRGYSWDYDRGGVWVDHGCRADFEVGDGERQGRGYQMVSCNSNDMRRHYCESDVRGDVHLVDEHSDAPCKENYSWGHDNRGIWVDHGCRGDFVIEQQRGRGPGRGYQTVSCASDDMRRHVCPANVRGGVQILEQHSDSACRLGYSWGFNQNGIWVDHGCRADFAVQQGGGGGGQWPGQGNDNNNDRFFTCSSEDGNRHYCEVNARGNVRLVKQRSGSACREGYSWGQDRKGVWVDHGCRADFEVERGGRPPDSGNGQDQFLTCSSEDGKRHYCSADTRGGVRMVKQRSGSACTQGYSWGFDRKGVWVDHGCRADFQVIR